MERHGQDNLEHICQEIAQTRIAAARKYGPRSIEDIPVGDPDWIKILLEEVGGVAGALLHDGCRRRRLREALLQVSAVAVAWICAIDDGRGVG